MTEEADTSIQNSYNEGYKQAVIEYKPEVDYWKDKYKKDNSLSKKIKAGGICIGAGLITGLLIGLAVN